MFRRWLVSGLRNDTEELDFVKGGANPEDVILVGKNWRNSKGDKKGGAADERVFAPKVELTRGGHPAGGYAWWVGGQNQKVDALMLSAAGSAGSAAVAESRSGVASAADVKSVPDFKNLDTSVLDKLASYQTLALANVSKDALQTAFHHVAAGNSSVIADVRWGGLKKDLNLLFEGDTMPRDLTRVGRNYAIGPRSLSEDLRDYHPKLDNRGFSSFEMMREYYRLYKNSGDSPLRWSGQSPETDRVFGHDMVAGQQPHAAEKGYRRMPVLLKYYMVLSIRSEEIGSGEPGTPGNYNHDLVNNSVVVLWNPYNVPLEMESDVWKLYTLPYKLMPIQFRGYKNGAILPQNEGGKWKDIWQNLGGDEMATLSSGNSDPIRFEPGQIRIFSKHDVAASNAGSKLKLLPGYRPDAVQGFASRLYSNKPKDGTRWQIALRLVPNGNQNPRSWGGSSGSFAHRFTYLGSENIVGMGTMFDWTAEDYDHMLITDTGNGMACCRPGIQDSVPVAIVGISLKTSVRAPYEMDFDSSLPPRPGNLWPVRDYRSKNWIHGQNASDFLNMKVCYNDDNTKHLQRLDNGYQLHFTSVNGTNDLTHYFQVNPANLSTLGTAQNSENVQSVPVLELPTAPVTSLAGFAGMRLTPGWYLPVRGNGQQWDANGRYEDYTAGYVAGVPGLGVGNSFAHPMIPKDKVYAYHDVSRIYEVPNDYSLNMFVSGVAPSEEKMPAKEPLSDYWDHALLVNDGLWDSWFTSSLVDERRPTDSGAKSWQDLLSDFYLRGESLPAFQYAPWLGKLSRQGVVDELEQADGYRKVAGHMLNRATFNVNSTSVPAWRAVLGSLLGREMAYRDGNGTLKVIKANQGEALVSRFNTPVAGEDTSSDPLHAMNVPNLGRTWSGVRVITEKQLDRLAEECVKQVKLRGPFLNMSDFVNRRLSTDDKTAFCGALQAAIDYDDSKPDSKSINYRYKGAGMMITNNDHSFANYPFEAAANGSRFTGAPGYVMQSDVLRPLGNSLTVRDDTYVIRAYGEAKGKNGKVTARAWCEAVVRRVPEFVDGSDEADAVVTPLDAEGNVRGASLLDEVNQRYGRRFQITSFRWLSPEEV